MRKHSGATRCLDQDSHLLHVKFRYRLSWSFRSKVAELRPIVLDFEFGNSVLAPDPLIGSNIDLRKLPSSLGATDPDSKMKWQFVTQCDYRHGHEYASSDT